MRPVLRSYQRKFVKDVRGAWRRSPQVLAQMATGGGKTVTACAMIERAVQEWEMTCVVLVHRIELRKQWAETLSRFGVDHGVVAPGVAPAPAAPVQIAQVGALAARIRAGKRWSASPTALLVIDEAHHTPAATYQGIIEVLQPRGMLGLTATPARLDGKPLSPPFGEMVLGPPVEQLIREGALSDYVIRSLDLVSTTGVRKTAGDYNRGEAGGLWTDRVMADAVRHWQHEAGGRQTLVFATTREAGRKLRGRFQDAGVAAGYADGSQSSAERSREFGEFEENRTQVLVTVDIIGEGYDCPAASCAVLCRPTTSIVLHLQQIGRVLRPSGSAALILDTVGNTQRLGGPRTPMGWSLTKRVERLDAPKEAPTRILDGIQRQKRGEVRTVDVQLVTVDDRTISGRVRQGKSGGWDARDVAALKRRCRSLADFQALAEALGYRRTWAIIQYEQAREFWHNTISQRLI